MFKIEQCEWAMNGVLITCSKCGCIFAFGGQTLLSIVCPRCQDISYSVDEANNIMARPPRHRRIKP